MIRLLLAVFLVFSVLPRVAAGVAGTPDRVDSTPVATAAPTASNDPGSLTAMLERLPALPFGGSESPSLTYANVAVQLAAVGVPTRSSLDDEGGFGRWAGAVEGLSFPSYLSRYGAQPDWRAAFGFDLFAVDQAVEYAKPPAHLTLYRGRFDTTELRTAWEREGYRPSQIYGQTVYSIRDDFELEVASTSGRMAFASMNHALILADGMVAFSSTLAALRGVLGVEAGLEASFAQSFGLPSLLASAPPDLVSAMLVPGVALDGPVDPILLFGFPTAGTPMPDVEVMATQIADAARERRRLPPVLLALIGMTAGGPVRPFGEDGTATPEPLPPGAAAARLVVVIKLTNPTAADTAAAVVEDRLATQSTPEYQGGRAFAELFPQRTVRVVAGEPIVVIELLPAADVRRTIVNDLYFFRALSFVAWGG